MLKKLKAKINMAKKVLLVDDNKEIRNKIKTQINALGLVVIDLENPFLAIDILHETKVDYVILDQFMPHLDGVTLAKDIQLTLNNIPIIIMCMQNLTKVKNSFTEFRNLYFIEKPIDKFKLLPLLQRI